LVEANRFSKKRLDNFSEKIKIISNLETRVRNIPQTGKFKITKDSESYTFRVSTIPTISGEKISISVLRSSLKPPNLVELGYWGVGLTNIKRALSKPSGLILLCGQKGSGRSMSLFSMLSSIDSDNLKIASIEDPVEYLTKNVSQTQVNHKTGLSFSSGLRILDKQDNDIIMVSEFRDAETVNLAIGLASRNRLILSTIYSNSIYSALNKLNDAGISRALIAHSLSVVSSQRLVRKLCFDCREKFLPGKAMLSLIFEEFGLADPARMKYIHHLEQKYIQEMSSSGSDFEVSNPITPSTTETKIKFLWRQHEGGCSNCQYSGYNGLLGIFEVVNVSPAISRLIVSVASSRVIFAKATSEGTIGLLSDGLVKALSGRTSVDELISLNHDYI
jgi:type IV pilus assembly protein PilB